MICKNLCTQINIQIILIGVYTCTFSSETSRDFKLLPTTRNSSSNSTIFLYNKNNSQLDKKKKKKQSWKLKIVFYRNINSSLRVSMCY